MNLGVFETSAAIRAQDQPRVVELRVTTAIMRPTVGVLTLGLPDRGASSTCSISITFLRLYL